MQSRLRLQRLWSREKRRRNASRSIVILFGRSASQSDFGALIEDEMSDEEVSKEREIQQSGVGDLKAISER